MPWTLCTSFGFFKLGSPFEYGMAPSPQVPQSFLHRFALYCLISVIDKVNISHACSVEAESALVTPLQVLLLF